VPRDLDLLTPKSEKQTQKNAAETLPTHSPRPLDGYHGGRGGEGMMEEKKGEEGMGR